MSVKPATPEAYKLFHDGVLALSEVESNGMRIDVEYLDKAIIDMDRNISRLEEEMKQDPVYKLWKKEYGPKTNFGSGKQLEHMLFDVMKIPCSGKMTGKGASRSVDKEALADIDVPFVKNRIKLEADKKAVSTYLRGIRREVVGELLRPSFNLHTVSSYRSSCSNPNSQNIPIRDPIYGKLIRKAFIARKGHRFVELDFKGIEVSVNACVVGTTLIETIDGPQTIRQVIRRVRNGEDVRVYGYCKERRRICVSKVTRGGLTKKKAKVWKVTLDNGESVTATENHKFLLRNGTYKELRNLREGDSLMPFYDTPKKEGKVTYRRIYLNNGLHMKAHNLIALDVHGVTIAGSDKVVHHKDSNGSNNSLDNLEIMTRREHMRIHAIQGWERKPGGERHTTERRKKMSKLSRKIQRERRKNWTEADWAEHGARVSEGIRRNGGRKGERNPRYGVMMSDETKKKISLARKGVPSPMKGIPLSEETKRKLSESKKGKPSKLKGIKRPPFSDEWRRKLSESGKGHIRTESTRQKSRESHIARWTEKKKGPKESCPICQKEFVAISTHMYHKHGTTVAEYKATYNHKVVSIVAVGRENVYNINVEKVHNYATTAGVVIKNCYNKDPNLVKYVTDPTTDMHRDMAMQCYRLKQSEVSKNSRYCAKNMFVFPEFYGDYYIHCAKYMWDAINRMDLKVQGTDKSLKEHLAEKGITKLGDCNSKEKPKAGTFEKHIKAVEDDFWGNRFAVYKQWKDDWWKKYQKHGYFELLTGFRAVGTYSKNQCTNIPAQGAAFHCLLWSLIQMQKWLTKNKMKSLIIGQIHDSMLLDVHRHEMDEVIGKATEITTKNLAEHWKWISVPMRVDIEASERGGSWYSKKPIAVHTI